MPDDYSLQMHMHYTTEAKRIIDNDLPPFCADYFRSLLNNTKPLTRYGYAVDLRMFFNYLINEKSEFSGKTVKQLTPSDMEKITATDIELYLEYVSMYSRETVSVHDDGTESVSSRITVNMESSRARKLAAIRSMF